MYSKTFPLFELWATLACNFVCFYVYYPKQEELRGTNVLFFSDR